MERFHGIGKTGWIKTEDLGYLGIVSEIGERIGLIEQSVRVVGPTERKESVREATQAMVLNDLGSLGRPFQLTPEFVQTKRVARLVWESGVG